MASDPKTTLADPELTVEVDTARFVMPGVQPFLYDAGEGVLLVQSQLNTRPRGNRRRINHYAWQLENHVSRDSGATWQELTVRGDEDPFMMEGGSTQLDDGRVLMLDTYITPASEPDTGEGDLWISRDGWRTLEDPISIRFDIPNVNFDASSDDGGHPHRAIRLHRSLIQLPNGDLLTTAYGWLHGDAIPCPYQTTMMKARTLLLRSRDVGRSWQMISTVAAGDVGTEGFVEPTLCRLSQGRHAGRLLCLMRTGVALYCASSDDNGVTWSAAAPLRLPVAMDGHQEDDNDPDAWVDPELIEMANGLLVCAVGLRTPGKGCFGDPSRPANGNYLAFSRDGGDTWSHLLQLTSGVMTTHYMGVRETAPNQLYVTYDLGKWGEPECCIMGCTVRVRTNT